MRRLGTRKGPRGSPAFTLIELLVVVAIIGLLLAILMPSLQQARRAADRTTCISQLRNIGVALHMFHDHYGRLHGPSNARQGFLAARHSPNSSYMVSSLRPFLGEPEYQPWMAGTEVRVMRCPAHRRALGPWDSPDYPSWHVICYIANRAGPRVFGSNNANDPDDPSRRLQPLPLTAVVSHSRIWALMDADSGPRGNLNTTTGEPPTVPVHGNVRNVLFLDGHAQSRPVEDGTPPTPAR